MFGAVAVTVAAVVIATIWIQRRWLVAGPRGLEATTLDGRTGRPADRRLGPAVVALAAEPALKVRFRSASALVVRCPPAAL
jgi:hypothetical protein